MDTWKPINTTADLPENGGLYEITCFDQSSKANKTFVGRFKLEEKRFYLVTIGFHGHVQEWTCDPPLAYKNLSAAFQGN